MNQIVQESSAMPVKGWEERFLSGLELVEEVVGATYGGDGGNVMVAGAHGRQVFDDGYKALTALVPSDPIAREAVFYMRDAADAQRRTVGDGTSTTALLSAGLIRAGLELKQAGHKPSEIVEAFGDLVNEMVLHLKAMARTDVPREAVVKAATLAMHGRRDLGEVIGGLVSDLGKDGEVMFVKGKGGDVSAIKREGLVWKGGVVDAAMLQGSSRMEMKDTLVFFLNDSVDNIQASFWAQVFEAFQQMCASDKKQYGLLLVCNGAGGSVLSTFMKQGWGIVRTPPGINPSLSLADLAAVTGGRVYGNLHGNIPDTFDYTGFGIIPGFFATKYNTCISLDEDVLEEANRRADILRDSYASDDLKSSEADQGELALRLAVLSGGFGEVSVPYVSEVDFSSLKEVLEDGYLTAKAALEGVLPGGGSALYAASRQLPPIGAAAFFSMAIRGVTDLAGGSGSSLEPWIVYDVRIQEHGDAVELGILDAFKVVESALRIANSTAAQVINTRCVLEQRDNYVSI